MKTVYIIHGWDKTPNDDWFPWLKKELENHGFNVVVPQMPNTEEPRIKNWVPEIEKVVKSPNKETYFVGHSIGCQAIARYLETLKEGVVIGGVVFVAGFFEKLSNLEDEEVVRDVAKEWLETPVDFGKIKSHINKSVAIFSNDDEYVPIGNKENFEKLLGSRIIVKDNYGHFNEESNTFELPIALESVLEISK